MIPILLLVDNESYEDFQEIKEAKNTILLIFLFIGFVFINAFKNLYRVLTIQYYSSMTRALAESILDPFILFYYLFLTLRDNKGKKEGNLNNFFIFS